HANNGSTIALHDEIKAVAAAGNTEGYTVTIQGGTFSQIGQNARVFIPGKTTLTYGTHRLEGGARYQTYDANGASFGSYELKANATLAAKGAGNVLASEKYTFAPNSTLGFDLTGATPGAGTALLALAGGEVDTSNGGVLPGQNNVALSGNVTAQGNYYLLNATTTTATGQTSPVNTTGGTLLTDSLTFNGNPVSAAGAMPADGRRVYATATLNTGTPGGATTGDKLYVEIANTGYNIVNSWSGPLTGGDWKAELSTTGTGNWSGQMYVNDQGATATANTFLNGDVVRLTFQQVPSNGNIPNVAVDPVGVTVGGMVVDGCARFSGGPITGRASSTIVHSLDTNLRTQANGTLLITNGANVTFTNTIDFAGNNGKAGIQVDDSAAALQPTSPGSGSGSASGRSGASELTLVGPARLGANDDQNVHLTSGAGAARITFNLDADYTYKGTISGDGHLVKDGNTTLTLAKDQTFTGGFAIAGGTVVLTNNISLAAGMAWVQPNTTLVGSSIVSVGGGVPFGRNTLYSLIMGTLSPGVGSGNVGKLTFGASVLDPLTFGAAKPDNVTLHASAKLIVDIQGTNADLVEVGGSILIENNNGSGATLELGTVAGHVPANAEYVILSAIGGTSPASTSAAAAEPPPPSRPTSREPAFSAPPTASSSRSTKGTSSTPTVSSPARKSSCAAPLAAAPRPPSSPNPPPTPSAAPLPPSPFPSTTAAAATTTTATNPTPADPRAGRRRAPADAGATPTPADAGADDRGDGRGLSLAAATPTPADPCATGVEKVTGAGRCRAAPPS
ncbi:MAG: hypothetical protein LBG65_05275, partial [Puniceicoccales bacterium]|nr:hypothetical protein [Puniceicoccales bacterium]